MRIYRMRPWWVGRHWRKRFTGVTYLLAAQTPIDNGFLNQAAYPGGSSLASSTGEMP